MPDIREALAKVLADEKDGLSALEATLMALRAKAVKGDVKAASLLPPSSIRIELVAPDEAE
jgi:hypothetical protein